jgi:DNA-binding PadR family transcriptional regulator
MPNPRWRAWDFDPSLFEAFSCAGGLAGQLREALWSAGCAGGLLDELRETLRSASCGGGLADHLRESLYGMSAPGGGSRSRGRGFAGAKGFGRWGGGSGGAWGAWWPGPPGPPWGAPRGAKAARGDVRAAILALLREGPRTGYQIMSDIEARSGGAWRPSPGAVYPALAALADEGLIVGQESAGRRTFTLTEAGREYVEQNPDMARGAWESQSQQEDWRPPGLFAEAARLAGGIVQVANAGTPEQVRAAERLLEQTRRRLYQILAEEDDADGEEDAEVEDEPYGGEHGNE